MNNILIVTADHNCNIGAPHQLSWIVSHVFFNWRICKSLTTTLAVAMYSTNFYFLNDLQTNKLLFTSLQHEIPKAATTA